MHTGDLQGNDRGSQSPQDLVDAGQLCAQVSQMGTSVPPVAQGSGRSCHPTDFGVGSPDGPRAAGAAGSCERQGEMEKMSPTCSRGTWQDV